MQRMMLSWNDDAPNHPTAFDICAAHAALVPGGGMLRTGGVRAGRTKFATPPHQVQRRLEALVVALKTVSARDDLSAVAKAAWASYNFLSLHPFADGNGRLARGLMNMVLARNGMPFVVSLAASESQRASYRSALVSAHVANDVKPWAVLVQQSVARGWAALEPLWQQKRANVQAAAEGQSARQVRASARAAGCMICLDDGPTCTLLCCGGAFHIRCLSRWLAASGTTCPGCRAPVPPDERPTEPAPASAPAPAPALAAVPRVVYVRADDTTEEDDTTANESFTVADDTTVDDDSLGSHDDTTANESFTVADDTTVDDESLESQDDTTVDESFSVADDTTVDDGNDGSVELQDDTTFDDTTFDDTTADHSELVVVDDTTIDDDDDTNVDADDSEQY